MPNRSDIVIGHAVQGKVIYLLALIVVGILFGRNSRFHTAFIIVTGVIYLSNSLLYALNPRATRGVVLNYLVLMPYLGMLLWILGRFLAPPQHHPRWDISRCPCAVAAIHLFFVYHPDLIQLRRYFARFVVSVFACQPGDNCGRIFHHHRHVAAGVAMF